MRFLVIGDVIGRTGRRAVKEVLPFLKEKLKIDFVVLNGENLAHGNGITKPTFDEILTAGVDVITSGNHTFDKKEVYAIIDDERLLRPANLPPLAKGKGFNTYEKNGKKITVINLMGRVFMGIPLDCPFRAFDEIYNEVKDTSNYIIVDFHGEATSEKQAFGYYVDSRATLVFGTHTHVQTSDERFLPKGTAYISDVGLTGAYNSVIGVKSHQIIEKFITGMPVKYEPEEGNYIFQALFLDTEEKQLKRIQIKEGENYEL
ncbi:TIGR00282 family metallophosphoesterase [Sulfurihydrogenibium subterraneum]|uniref:TIGR00282 family metallophosphoesterase n=1 Tax=Sulfurihydrogenibium subterraneum TaxID=171121 RepID=UPI0004907746|nr:TIGR00282 family metallophosphoesterase [Sulfurihydrogenibium subterraneum]